MTEYELVRMCVLLIYCKTVFAGLVRVWSPSRTGHLPLRGIQKWYRGD